MTWFSILIPAIITLVVSFGVLYFTRRFVKQDQGITGISGVSVAKIGAEGELIGLLLDRIEKLEARVDQQFARGQERNVRIDALESANNECEVKLTEVTDQYNRLREHLEKQLLDLKEAT